jgi:polar amino acid transport system substrate-binding protein
LQPVFAYELLRTRHISTKKEGKMMRKKSMHQRRAAKKVFVSTGLVLGAAVALIVFGVTCTYAESTLERARARGYIRIAIANEPPYTEVKPDGKVTGAAPEVTRAVMKKLGVPEILATVVEYGAMIPGLQAGRFDIVSAGLFMKPERCQAVLYSQPDVCGAEGMLVKKGNPLNIQSHNDIANNPKAKVGVCGGCIEEKYAKEAGVPAARIVIVPDVMSGLKMVQDGRIDAYAMPILSLRDGLKRTKAMDLEIYGPTKNLPIACAGAAFRKSDRELRDAYDKALQELKDSGEFSKILEPFGFSAEAAIMTKREQLCGGPN